MSDTKFRIFDTGILKADPYVLVDENEKVLAASYEQNGEHNKDGLLRLTSKLMELVRLEGEVSKRDAELATLRAQLAEAIEIIKPFAAESEMWGSKTPDEETPTIRGKDGKGDEAVFTVGDLRAAARFLDKVTTA